LCASPALFHRSAAAGKEWVPRLDSSLFRSRGCRRASSTVLPSQGPRASIRWQRNQHTRQPPEGIASILEAFQGKAYHLGGIVSLTWVLRGSTRNGRCQLVSCSLHRHLPDLSISTGHEPGLRGFERCQDGSNCTTASAIRPFDAVRGDTLLSGRWHFWALYLNCWHNASHCCCCRNNHGNVHCHVHSDEGIVAVQHSRWRDLGFLAHPFGVYSCFGHWFS